MNLQDLFKNAENAQEFKAGSVVFTEGEPGDVMFVVLEGELEVSVQGNVVASARAGDLLGEMALLDAKERSATVIARSDCRLVPIDEKRFLYMVQQTPFFSLHVMRSMADKLRRMNVIN